MWHRVCAEYVHSMHIVCAQYVQYTYQGPAALTNQHVVFWKGEETNSIDKIMNLDQRRRTAANGLSLLQVLKR